MKIDFKKICITILKDTFIQVLIILFIFYIIILLSII